MVAQIVHFIRRRTNPRGIIAPLAFLSGAGCVGYLALVTLNYGPFNLLYFACLAMTFGGTIFARWLADLSPAIGVVALCWLCSAPMSVNFLYDASQGRTWTHGFFWYYLAVGLLFAYTTPRHALVYSCGVSFAGIGISIAGQDLGPMVILPIIAVVEFVILLKAWDKYHEQKDLNKKLLVDNEELKGQFNRVARYYSKKAARNGPK